MERPGDRDWYAAISGWVLRAWTAVRRILPMAAAQIRSRGRRWRILLLPQVVDRYVLKSFLFWFALLLVGFVAMTHVYTFFDLLSDIVKNQHRDDARVHLLVLSDAAAHFRFRAHERAGGGSDHLRRSHQAQRNHGHESQRHQPVPAVRPGADGGVVDERRACSPSRITMCRAPIASRTRFARRSRASRCKPICIRTRNGSSIRDRITIRAFSTSTTSTARKRKCRSRRCSSWTPANFHVRKHISAEKARWEPTLHTWVFENGWSREIPGGAAVRSNSITSADRPRRLPRSTSGPIISCKRCCRISR